ncbi:MAG: hypothetical protein PVSMB5_18980 [Ktedonobacteraceae bacterium]
MLVDHTNAQTDSVAWATDLRNLPVNQNLATIGMDQAIEDIHERGFSGAIFAHQRVYLTLAYRQVHMVAGHNAGPGLIDIAHLHRQW